MVSEPIYIASDGALVSLLKARGFQAYLFSETLNIDGDNFVFVGKGARENMEFYRSRGVPAHELNWQDDLSGQVRHYHWDMVRQANDFVDEDSVEYLDCGITGLGMAIDKDHGCAVRWRYPELGIIAGPYGSGKSLFAQLIAQDFVRQHNVPASLCCWEDQIEDIRDGLLRHANTALLGLGDGVEYGVKESAMAADRRNRWLSMFQLAVADPTKDRFISEYIELIEFQVRKFNTKFFVFDPWNEFDHQKHSKQTETEYVREVMKKLRKVVDLHRIIVYVVTHISGDLYSNDGAIKAFRIANSFGSSNFGAKADRGFCVAQMTRLAGGGGGSHMIVRQDKVKQADVFVRKNGVWELHKRKMGRKATIALQYSWTNHSLYWDRQASADSDLQKIWKG